MYQDAIKVGVFTTRTHDWFSSHMYQDAIVAGVFTTLISRRFLIATFHEMYPGRYKNRGFHDAYVTTLFNIDFSRNVFRKI